ncbi:MAG TPA: helix-turn-helix transcriptional regulator [Candidatus Ratteibacteria bacterium]|nr:helix-turn-helix transcriptional regulator [Candidatus Ratteibacteria bacterium]
MKIEKDKINVLLKETRENNRIGIDEIIENTRIPQKYIKIIEDGQWEKFPSQTYLLGYLKIYCEYLNIKKEIIDTILSEFKQENKKEKEVIKEEKKDNVEQKREKILLIILPLIFFSIYFFTLYILSDISSNL